MKTVPTGTHIGLVPHVGHTLPWMNMTEGSRLLEDTAPGTIIVNGHPSRFGASITTAMDMDVALPLALGWKITLPHAVPTRTLMMPGLHLPHATTMIRI
jgi:hypothetical protein